MTIVFNFGRAEAVISGLSLDLDLTVGQKNA